MTIAEHLAAGRRAIEAAGVPAPEAALDAELLARHALGWDRARLLSRRHEVAAPEFEAVYAARLERRARREPVAYILGEQEFWSLPFTVSRDVLIPRPETELIVEEALAAFADGQPPALVIDVCTGSGCLAVALAREFGGADVVGTDISEAAIAVARANAHRHGVGGRIDFRAVDLLTGIAGRADLIVSNPPYVAARDAATLSPEVRDHEPHAALFAGEDGLAIYRRLLPAAAACLSREGWLILEVGFDQADVVADLGEAAGLQLEHKRQDLQGITRTLVFSTL